MVLKASSTSQIRKCRRGGDGGGRDRISELPEEILCHILSSLATIDVVRTSSLSKQWRYVCTSVPIIHLSFTGEIRYNVSLVREWIDNVVPNDHVKELNLDFSSVYHLHLELSPSIFGCKNLVVLKLNTTLLLNVPSSVCLLSLKNLHFDSVAALDVNFVNNLLTGCPVLEELCIKRCDLDHMAMKTMCLQSSSLKSFKFDSGGDYGCNPIISSLVIDACNLELLHLDVDVREQVDVRSCLPFLVSVRLSFSNRYAAIMRTDVCGTRVLELLRNMSNTKFLYLSSQEFMESVEPGHLDNLPMFENLTHLEVRLFSYSWPILPFLLESSPNLISFIIHKVELFGDWQMPHQLQHYMPKCFMNLYLEKIELDEMEMELVSYFLKNAPVLKKMLIMPNCRNPKQVSYKIFKLPKASIACDIEIMSSF